MQMRKGWCLGSIMIICWLNVKSVWGVVLGLKCFDVVTLKNCSPIPYLTVNSPLEINFEVVTCSFVPGLHSQPILMKQFRWILLVTAVFEKCSTCIIVIGQFWFFFRTPMQIMKFWETYGFPSLNSRLSLSVRSSINISSTDTSDTSTLLRLSKAFPDYFWPYRCH